MVTSTLWLVNVVELSPVYRTEPRARPMPKLPVAPSAFGISVYVVDPPRE